MLPVVSGALPHISAHAGVALVTSLVSWRAARPAEPVGEELMSGLRKFLFRGNLIDLAVAVVIGVAFNAVIQALIADIITPLIAAIGGKPNFGALSFTVHRSQFLYGSFLNALISFVTIAAVIYYLVVSPAARITEITTRNKEAAQRDCPECLSSIPIKARRCMYCTADVPPVTPPQRVPAD
jgi:large conductance mechanosensitive channel